MAGHTKRRNNLAALEAAGGMDYVCNELVAGKSIKQIAEQFDMWPMQLMRWIDEDDSRRLNYAQARENQAEAFAAELIEIADGANSDGDVNRDKLRVDARKWIASKLKPRTYGDKLAVGGAADLPAIQSTVTLDAADAYKALLEGKS